MTDPQRRARRFVGIATAIVLAGLLAVWLARTESPAMPRTPELDASTERRDDIERDPPLLEDDSARAGRSESSVETHAAADLDEFDATIVAPATGTLRLYGTVEGAPVPPVYVACCDERGAYRQQRVDASSHYEFTGLAPGRYVLRVFERNGVARRVVDLEEDTRADLRLDSLYLLRITVVDEKDVAWEPDRVGVVVTLADPGAWIREPPSWLMPAGPTRSHSADETRPELGSWWIEGPLPVHANLVRHSFVLATQTFGVGDQDLVFRVDRDDPRLASATVRFRAVDGMTRGPIEPRVRLHGSDGTRRIDAPGGVGTIALEAGEYALTASAAPDLLGSAHFRVEPGEELDLGEIALHPMASIRGTVVDEHEAGIQRSVISRRCDESGAALDAVVRRVDSAADGSFELRALERGFHRLSVKRKAEGESVRAMPDDFPARIVDLRAGDVEGVVLEDRPLVDLVLRPSGRETIESRFRVLARDGTVITSRAMSRDHFERVPVAPGEYEVERWHASDGPRPRVTVVVAGDPVAVDMP